jgi:hypothetical protein
MLGVKIMNIVARFNKYFVNSQEPGDWLRLIRSRLHRLD